MPFILWPTHDFVSVFNHVFSAGSLFVCPLDLPVLHLLKLNLAHERVESLADKLVRCLYKLHIYSEWQHFLAKLVDKLLDVSTLLIITEGDSLAVASSAGCSADSMQVALGLCRETEIQNSFNG